MRQFARSRDFILLHYCLTARRRDSALWRAMASMALPGTLAFRLDAWREHGVLRLYDEEGFDGHSRLAIHAGMQHWRRRDASVLQELSYNEAENALRACRAAIAEPVTRLPAHGDYLKHVLGR